MPEKPLILVIDDESGSRESMAIALEKAGLAVRTFDDARKALDYLAENEGARLAVCDLRMPGTDGLAFLQEVRERGDELAVVLVTGYGSIESAVEAMRVGADDYLTKPVDLYELRQRVMNLIEKQQLREEVTSLRQQLDKRYGFESIIGHSAPMERLFEQMQLVAPTRSTVLVVGESGTGKELVASAIHRASPRRNERFLAINCGAIPPDILESELFGHERGSFTGAIARKIGKFELAHRGTLFLDEISELYPELQVKLLRVLEERQIMRVGGGEVIPVDFRLLAATNRDLERVVAEGKFREDLYYRLKVVTLRIPPLRERPEDMPLLAEHFLALFAEEHGKPPKRLAPEALELLARFPWPGNVRQLKNVIESVVVFHQGDVVEPGDLPAEVRDAATVSAAGGRVQSAVGGTRTMEEIERQAILETLTRTGGHRAKAADLLGIGLRTLQRKLKEYKDAGFYTD
ncbi:MAG TPA: sigma-54 dependent transcriptional regulator [Thermoanaerobaculia bacterium]|nr:sigma-54 dependent transcriptional regulator [Thermoanaerobaculia bacterium]